MISAIDDIRLIGFLAWNWPQKFIENFKSAQNVSLLIKRVGAFIYFFGVSGVVNVAIVMDKTADFQSQKIINLAHPNSIAASQVIVDRDDMDAFAG